MLVDTSVWVDHLRHSDPTLSSLLSRGEVECHPFVIGELALGTLRRRSEILTLLHRLPQLRLVGDTEVLTFVDTHRLMGSGIGWIDAHLLASTAIDRTLLWTRDRRLSTVAGALNLGAHP